MASRYDELTRAALAEITPARNVGDWVEDRVRDDAPGVVDVVYTSAQEGYRGWSWIVSVAEVDGEAPTVLELGLIPGEDALLAPEWVPWSVRLAEWEAQQAAAAAEGAEGGEQNDDEAEDGLVNADADGDGEGEAGASGDDVLDDEDALDDDDDDDDDDDVLDDDDLDDSDEDDDDDDDVLDDDDLDDSDEDDDEDDDEEHDFDEDGPRATHGGDIDGVDIDDLDDTA